MPFIQSVPRRSRDHGRVLSLSNSLGWDSGRGYVSYGKCLWQLASCSFFRRFLTVMMQTLPHLLLCRWVCMHLHTTDPLTRKLSAFVIVVAVVDRVGFRTEYEWLTQLKWLRSSTSNLQTGKTHLHPYVAFDIEQTSWLILIVLPWIAEDRKANSVHNTTRHCLPHSDIKEEWRQHNWTEHNIITER